MLKIVDDVRSNSESTLPKNPLGVRLRLGRAYFVGLGGSGMRALATVMAGRGWEIRGCETSSTARNELADFGWNIEDDQSTISMSFDADIVIYSDAVAADHPVRVAAVQQGIRQCSYAQMLGRTMRGHQTGVVAGTHGKSTTTAMTAQILVAAGMDPTVVCGAGPVTGSQTGGLCGGGSILLAEACEYRENYLHLQPETAVVTGIEADHFDCFASVTSLEASFARFLKSVHGHLLMCEDCPRLMRHRDAATCEVETFGCRATADWRFADVRNRCSYYEFTIKHRGSCVGRVHLGVPGRHNMSNALAAAALSYRLGAGSDAIVRGLESYCGLRRRLEFLGDWRSVPVWDDFAHHPTEIAAALATLKERYPGHRIRCVFQPHQASRLRWLMDEFARSLQNADHVIVMPVYRAREGPWRTGEPTAADLAAAVRSGGTEVATYQDFGAALSQLRLACCPGDVIATLGAGDIWKLSHALTDRI